MGPFLLRKTESHEPTSRASPQKEPFRKESFKLISMLLNCTYMIKKIKVYFTISALNWASLRWQPPILAWPLCPAARRTRRGTGRKMWCADRPRQRRGWTRPRTCCIWSADDRPAQPPSCEGYPWYHSSDLGLKMIAAIWAPLSYLQGPVSAKLSLRMSYLLVPCMIPIGLYSRLADLFAFGTVQTGSSLTFTPLQRPFLLKSINKETSCCKYLKENF